MEQYKNKTEIRNPYISEIIFLHSALVSINFKNVNLEKSSLNSLQKKYDEIHSTGKYRLANVFYTHLLENKKIPLKTKLKFAEEIEGVHISHKALSYLILQTKEKTLNKLARKLYQNKKNNTKKSKHKKQDNLERKIQIQKLAQILTNKIEKDKENEFWNGQEAYNLGF